MVDEWLDTNPPLEHGSASFSVLWYEMIWTPQSAPHQTCDFVRPSFLRVYTAGNRKQRVNRSCLRENENTCSLHKPASDLYAASMNPWKDGCWHPLKR